MYDKSNSLLTDLITTLLKIIDMESGPWIVLRLVATLPAGSYIYFNTYFSTVSLMNKLFEFKMDGMGTIISNRLKGLYFQERQWEELEVIRSDRKWVLQNGKATNLLVYI